MEICSKDRQDVVPSGDIGGGVSAGVTSEDMLRRVTLEIALGLKSKNPLDVGLLLVVRQK